MIRKCFWFRFTFSVPEKFLKLVFEMPMIPKTWNINNVRTKSSKTINWYTIRKLLQYFLKNFLVKAIFTLSVFEILLFQGRLVLSPTQQGTGSVRLKVSVKNQKHIQILLKLLEKNWITSLGDPEWFLSFIDFVNLFSTRMTRIFEMSITPQTLNNNLGITSVKPINLHTVKKRLQYSLQKFLVNAMFTLTALEILLFEGRSVLSTAQRGTGSQRNKSITTSNRNIQINCKWIVM